MPWLPIVDDCRSAADVRARCASTIRHRIEARKPISHQAQVARLPFIKTDTSDLRQTADDMIECVCKLFQVDREAIITGGKRRNEINARWTAIYMTVKLTGRGFSAIAPCFGQKWHAAIQRAWYVVSDLRRTNKFHPISRAVAEIEAALANQPPPPKPQVPTWNKVKTKVQLERIVTWSCRYFETTRMELFGECRMAKLVNARHVGFYLARKVSGKSMPQIAAKYGGLDHTSVLHGVRKIEQKIADGDESTIAAIRTFQNSLAEFAQ